MSRDKLRAPRIVAGRHRGRVLAVPAGLAVRPTAHRTREALFNILEHGSPAIENARFLDLFSGSGAIGLEAVSRGSADVLMVENDRRAAAAVRVNIRAMGEEGRARVQLTDATRLGRCPQPFDIIYLDPPYRSGMADQALEAILNGGWLADGGRIVCELAAKDRLSLPAGLRRTDERRYGAGRLVMLEPHE